MLIGSAFSKFLFTAGVMVYSMLIANENIEGDKEPNGTPGEKIVEMSFEEFKQ
jgi:hypothetical protein